jgi:predicted NBD/HSP70 family sugar kinase
MDRTRSAVRPDEIRRHNLSLLLDEIHRHGELSRAELTQRTGLNRSTIGALVAELTDLRLLCEQVPTSHVRAGRPSHLVGPQLGGPFVIAVDLDVDRLASAAVGLSGTLLFSRGCALGTLDRRPNRVADLIATDVEALIACLEPDARPVGVGVSIPGTVTRDRTGVALSPNLNWHNIGFAALVEDRIHQLTGRRLPVELGNDADLGVLAEHLRGAARDCADVVFLTGRTGVGAGILVNGVALRGHQGLAGEIGHVVLDPAGPPCHCGNAGCVETYIGQAAVLREVGCPTPPGRQSMLWLDDLVSTLDAGADTGAVANPLVSGMRAVAEPLGRTIANLVNVLNPQRIVLAGILDRILRVARDDVELALHRHVFDHSRGAAELCPAGLGANSSLIGAAELAFQRLLANPLVPY